MSPLSSEKFSTAWETWKWRQIVTIDIWQSKRNWQRCDKFLFSSEVVCLYNDNDDDHSGLVWFGLYNHDDDHCGLVWFVHSWWWSLWSWVRLIVSDPAGGSGPVKTSPMKIPSKYPLQDFISQLGQILKVFKDNFFLYKVYFWDMGQRATRGKLLQNW